MKISDDFAAGSSEHGPAFLHDSPGPDAKSGSGVGEGNASEAGASAGEAPASKRGVVEILLLFVQEVTSSTSSLLEVYRDRVRLGVRRTLVRFAIGAGAAVCIALWLGASALAVLRGICGGFTALFVGREWLGDLIGGLVALALTAIAVTFHLRLTARRELARLKAKYERIRNEHSNTDAASAGNGGGIARSAGSPGDPADRGLGAAHG